MERDRAHGGIVKLNPLAGWSEDQVWEYLRAQRRALQRPLRPGIHQHRLRAMHPCHPTRRRSARRPLVVGGRGDEGVRHALHDRLELVEGVRRDGETARWRDGRNWRGDAGVARITGNKESTMAHTPSRREHTKLNQVERWKAARHPLEVKQAVLDRYAAGGTGLDFERRGGDGAAEVGRALPAAAGRRRLHAADEDPRRAADRGASAAHRRDRRRARPRSGAAPVCGATATST